MPSATLQWAEKSPPVVIGTRADLESRLREVATESASLPVLAVLSMADGSAGYIGLGRSESVVFLHGIPVTDGLTDEWIPVVDETREGVVEFFLLGQHHCEFEARSALPLDDAIRVLGQFFESGSRPAWMQWEESAF
jgi:hypothetical protein